MIGVQYSGRPGIAPLEIGRIVIARYCYAVKRMTGSTFIVPGARGVFSRRRLVDGRVCVGTTIVDAALVNNRTGSPIDRRTIIFVLVRQRAPAQELARAASIGGEADILAHAPEQPQVRIGVLGIFIKPRQ